MVESLRTRGYNGSSDHRLHYALLAQGSEGIEKLGRIIDTKPIQLAYANIVLGQTIQQYEYDGLMPSAVTPFNIRELAATRLDLPQPTSVWAGRLIAEHAFGLSLTVQHALANDRLGDYVVDSGTAERSVDAEAFFADLDPDDIELLDNMHNKTKVDFLDEISHSFVYGTSVFGSGLDVRKSVYAAKS